MVFLVYVNALNAQITALFYRKPQKSLFGNYIFTVILYAIYQRLTGFLVVIKLPESILTRPLP